MKHTVGKGEIECVFRIRRFTKKSPGINFPKWIKSQHIFTPIKWSIYPFLFDIKEEKAKEQKKVFVATQQGRDSQNFLILQVLKS